jgi:AraC-like DNA-binding protein
MDVGERVSGYRERASQLPGAVIWSRTDRSAVGDTRVLPDGCMDLIWLDGNLLVAGPDTTAWLSKAAGRYVGLRFAPGDAPAFLQVPAAELRDQRVPLAELWSARLVRRLAGEVTSAADRGAALERVVSARMRPTDPAVAVIVASLRSGANVAATAGVVDLGARRLHRRCLDAFGYGPKTLARILRMNRAIELARAGSPFATVASDAGYADQAHLARDVKAMTGTSLRRLISVSAAS